MNNKQTEKIKLWGIVQGVGFRPFVAKMAQKLSMVGEVLNIGGLVEITLTDEESRIDAFLNSLIANKPGPSEIVHVKREVIDYKEFDAFHIVSSGHGADEAAMIPADLAICPSCLEELYQEGNPREKHPFISCMICGPRYTIIDKIPYDRDNTTMIDFPMCEFCESEYTDIANRRYHAQTISCHHCGPQLCWNSKVSGDTSLMDDKQILDKASEILRGGGIIAFKSVGGYNLVADPFNEEAVAKLREFKHRPSKPFAVMFRSLDEISSYCNVNEIESKLLTSSARPIILLEHKLNQIDTNDKYIGDLITSRFIGSFLPSFAAQYMLLDRISPLIFTSANTSDMPMIKDDDEMLEAFEKTDLIDGLIYNKRRILTRVDDSVVRVIDQQPQMIRRSKGYAPVPLFVDNEKADTLPQILATGSQLKNSFALTKGPFVYMSQYFGDMDTIENQNLYLENIERMKSLFRIQPTVIACDMHPLYFTSQFAAKCKDEGYRVIPVQHHHAHVCSVIAENDLKGPVIGVSFDGTGYGTDGNIWGGEFMVCRGADMERVSHLKYVNMIGGDTSMKDAAKSALSYIASYAKSTSSANEIDLDISDIIKFGRERLLAMPSATLTMKAIEAGINVIKSSSMGRLFDAVSSLLGICDYNQHEGKCAMMLEDAAAFAKAHPGEDPASDLALAFHDRIIDMILDQCEKIRESSNEDINQVALTGGTFQNKILMEGVLTKLRNRGFKPYYNISVSPNDGGIALGQAYAAMQQILTEY